MRLSDFDFTLPAERIARFPAERRDGSRLLMLERRSGAVSHHRFAELPDLLETDDFLVMNNSRVLPARLLGRIAGKAAELLVVRDLGDNTLEVLCRPAAQFIPGAEFIADGGPRAEVLARGGRGRRQLRFDRETARVLEHGYAPLPPYIKRKAGEAAACRDFDLERYQTVYARDPGSIAAPTAGLHFTPEVLARVRERHPLLEITLDVGEATFQKIESEDISRHRMGSETIRIDSETARRLLELRSRGGRLLAVGTTAVRSLESFARLSEPLTEFASDIFISPGFDFRLVDKLLTNFHLPKSSLFILASAFAGLEALQEAYRQAIAEKYRFFSYGDAMLIV
ncbi:MAG: tRNA preQ1(34) S-adenosylmethionine ribosyltransferase-isomerase QueA [Acidobacteria bacterium]|jgi:S-adenosylmethionine:tRNA ribosyltransferase-isomerase|nr:tRNA preQ1(34) S-adenosylmethionine ribosyltransferase-isomerase QueA [Acidobacteriota bacterium]